MYILCVYIYSVHIEGVQKLILGIDRMKEKPVIYLSGMLQHGLVGMHIPSSCVYHCNNCWGKLACQRPVAAVQYRCVGPGRV